jgi:hypothetical protein
MKIRRRLTISYGTISPYPVSTILDHIIRHHQHIGVLHGDAYEPFYRTHLAKCHFVDDLFGYNFPPRDHHAFVAHLHRHHAIQLSFDHSGDRRRLSRSARGISGLPLLEARCDGRSAIANLFGVARCFLIFNAVAHARSPTRQIFCLLLAIQPARQFRMAPSRTADISGATIDKALSGESESATMPIGGMCPLSSDPARAYGPCLQHGIQIINSVQDEAMLSA